VYICTHIITTGKQVRQIIIKEYNETSLVYELLYNKTCIYYTISQGILAHSKCYVETRNHDFVENLVFIQSPFQFLHELPLLT